MENLSRIWL